MFAVSTVVALHVHVYKVCAHEFSFISSFLLSSDLPWSCLHVHVLALFNYDVELDFCTFSALKIFKKF